MPKTTHKKTSNRKSRSKRGGALEFATIDDINTALTKIQSVQTCENIYQLDNTDTLKFESGGEETFKLVVLNEQGSTPLHSETFTLDEIINDFTIQLSDEGSALVLNCPPVEETPVPAAAPPNALTTGVQNVRNPGVQNMPNPTGAQNVPNGAAVVTRNANGATAASANGSARGGKKSKGKKATSKRVKVGGAERVVYEGPRGGEYIKMNGGFVNLKELSKKRSA